MSEGKTKPWMNTREMTLVAVMAALICAAGPLSVPVGPIPISLASLAVYLAGSILGAKRGAVAVLLYLLLGTIGIPVFSGFSGGFQKLAGATGGYLVGYLPCAFLAGLGVPAEENRSGIWRHLAMLVAGTGVLYLLGTLWFMAQTGRTLAESLSLCVLPFLPGDAVKIALTLLVTLPVRRVVRRFTGANR